MTDAQYDTTHLKNLHFQTSHKRTTTVLHAYVIKPEDFLSWMEPEDLEKWNALSKEEQSDYWRDFERVHCPFAIDDITELTDCEEEEENCGDEHEAYGDRLIGANLVEGFDSFIRELQGHDSWQTEGDRQKLIAKARMERMEECRLLADANEKLKAQIKENEIQMIQAQKWLREQKV